MQTWLVYFIQISTVFRSLLHIFYFKKKTNNPRKEIHFTWWFWSSKGLGLTWESLLLRSINPIFKINLSPFTVQCHLSKSALAIFAVCSHCTCALAKKTRRLITLVSYLCCELVLHAGLQIRQSVRSVTSLHVWCEKFYYAFMWLLWISLSLMVRTSPSPWASCHFFSLLPW